MLPPPIPENEALRLEALEAYNVLDTPPEQAFEDITLVASQICGMPMAIISLIDKERQWFKSRIGIADAETSREYAFCAHAIMNPDELMEVADATKDVRFSDNPLVVEDPEIRFYAGSPLVTPDGFALGTLCVLDSKPNQLTPDQRLALKALGRQVVLQLELKKKIEELDEAKRKAEKATRMKEQFLSSMSHEMRTPLNAIVGATYLILDDNPRADQLKNLNILKFSSETLMSLISDILDINKIDAERIELEHVPVRIGDLVSSVQEAHSIRAEGKGITLYAQVHPSVPAIIMGDPVRIGQVLNNLVGNAVKFTDAGDVTLSVMTTNQTEQEVKLQFSVKDTGIGIGADQIKNIFKRFGQADASITRRFGGSGLGLYISSQLVQLMGGNIQVVSEAGEGSEFSFEITVPWVRETLANEEPLATRERITAPTAIRYRNLRALIVDDNATNQLILGQYLSRWGLQFATADNGQEAVDCLRDQQFDLVFMDIQMPVLDGYTATRYIREIDDPYFQKLPIIAVTASALIDVRRKVFASGMNDFIAKPFTPNQVLSKIQAFFGQETPLEDNEEKEVPQADFRTILDEITTGDDDFLRELSEALLGNTAEFLANAPKAFSASDEKQMNSLLHKLKPTLQTLKQNDAFERLQNWKKQPGLNSAEDFRKFAEAQLSATRKGLEALIQV